MKNEIFLDFRIVGFEDLTPDKITKIIGINPSKIIVKGEKRNPQKTDSKAIYKNNVWIVHSGLDKYHSFEQQMNALLDKLEPKIDLLKPLCQKYYSEFSCGLFLYYPSEESTPWVHLNSRYNKIIKELNTEFDIDLYTLPRD